MRYDEGRRKSGFTALLELGDGLLELGLRSLELLSAVVGGQLPGKHARERIPGGGRDADRELETQPQMLRRERIGTGLVVCFFAVAVLGGISFLIAYWSGGNNTQLLGGSLAVFLGGMGITLVLWARWLMTHKEAVEARHPVKSSDLAERATAKAFCDGVHDVRRRRLLTWMGLTGSGLFGMMVLSMLRSLGSSPDKSLYSRI